jgi:hypothetical protein
MQHARRLWRLIDWRFMAATVAITIALAIAGAVEDHRSCQRTQLSRQKFNAYVDAASTARRQSAQLERKSSPQQRMIDLVAARKFDQSRSSIPNCGGIIPDGR